MISLLLKFGISEKTIGFQSSNKKTKLGWNEIEVTVVFSDFFWKLTTLSLQQLPFFSRLAETFGGQQLSSIVFWDSTVFQRTGFTQAISPHNNAHRQQTPHWKLRGKMLKKDWCAFWISYCKISFLFIWKNQSFVKRKKY